jgi:hypothetical protein
MAVQQLTDRTVGRFLGWYHRETAIAASTTTNAVQIPPLPPGSKISTRVIAQTNDAKVQYTISADSLVVAGTAVWEDWPEGSNVGTKNDLIEGPVTGLRCVTGATSADTTIFEILI